MSLSRLAVVGWCLMLIVAGMLKTLQPERAGVFLNEVSGGWMGASLGSILAVLGGLTQVASGCGLLIWRDSRVVSRWSWGVWWILVTLDVLAYVEGLGECGCFGEVSVPRYVTAVVTAVGGLGLWGSRRERAERSNAGSDRWMRAAALSSLLIAMGLSVIGFARGASLAWAADKWEWEQMESFRRGHSRVLAMVGSLECSHCRKLLAEIEREIGAGQVEECAIVLIRPKGEGDGEASTAVEEAVHQVGVGQEVWFGLVGSSPPTLYVWDGAQATLVKVSEWRDELRR